MMRAKKPSISIPPSTPGPSSLQMDFALTNSPPNHDYGFSTSSQKGVMKGFNAQDMNRAASTASAPDYFSSSSGKSSSPSTVSRSSSSTSNHPWASLFPDGAAGAATSMPRVDQSASAMGSVNMASSVSMSNLPFKMPKPAQRMLSGGSGPSTSINTSTLTVDDLAKYRPIEPIELAQSLATAPSSLPTKADSTLIIDIRPSTSYAVARIRGSVNLCAPSTLLRRSGVTVNRIEEEMLSNEKDQIRFSGWRSGPQKDSSKRAEDIKGATPIDRIIVLDTDTTHAGEAGKPASGGGGPCLIGVLRKFDQAGYAGELQWLVGGFSGFSSKVGGGSILGKGSSDFTSLLDYGSVEKGKKDTASMKGPIPSLARSDSQRRSSAPVNKTGLSVGRPEGSVRQHSLVQPRGLPMEAFSLNSTTRRSSVGENRKGMQTSSSQPTFNSDDIPATGDVASSASANPFFDNIRQNTELQHGITERIPLELPLLSAADMEILPPFLRKLAKMEESERAEVLAKKFFDIEKAEQRRLIATMQKHAAESNLNGNGKDKVEKEKLTRQPSGIENALSLSSSYCAVKSGQNCDNTSSETFPFSIAAALERGGENRYNNIWTYEHSRVRCADASDYLNGSYIEPGKEFGCKRRYIATQAPLPSTFDTFWTVVWQQNVSTICMVTREFESGRVQSHNYWAQERYGNLSLRMVEEIYLDKRGKPVEKEVSAKQKTDLSNNGGIMFPSMKKNNNDVEEDNPAHTIKRRFILSQGTEERQVMHFQFIAWPDYSIPDDAEGILNYMKLANKEQHRAEVELKRKSLNHSEVGPLIVHCSAGVGRSGTYIVIDSVLDILRKKSRVVAAGKQSETTIDVWDDDWEVSSTVDSDVTMASPAVAALPLPSLLSNVPTVRKSLKRELSPSVMDVDVNEAERRSSQGNSLFSYNNKEIVSSARRGSSSSNNHPPLQRNRSDESEDLILSTMPFSFTSPPPSSGLETPSGAMGSMKIAWDSPQPTPTKSKGSKSSNAGLSSHKDGMVSPRNTSASLKPMALDEAPPLLSPPSKTTPQSSSSNDKSALLEVDYIQRTVETIREQRMSTVQTGRQYVFAYSAVLEGILGERIGAERGRKD